MIPKVIHYIWLGKKEKPNIVNICINSWKKELPEYNIIEWNEGNIDLNLVANENKFFSECRKHKLWAYMADYLRLKILYENGGIYFDTDIQVLKDFSPLLNDSCFVGYEANEYIGTGVIACEKGNKTIKAFLDFYDKEIWECKLFTIPQIITNVSKKNTNLKMTVYPIQYFAPVNPYIGYKEGDIKEDTYCIHWYNAGWVDNPAIRNFLEVKHIKNPVYKAWVQFRKNLRYYFRIIISRWRKCNH